MVSFVLMCVISVGNITSTTVGNIESIWTTKYGTMVHVTGPTRSKKSYTENGFYYGKIEDCTLLNNIDH